MNENLLKEWKFSLEMVAEDKKTASTEGRSVSLGIYLSQGDRTISASEERLVNAH